MFDRDDWPEAPEPRTAEGYPGEAQEYAEAERLERLAEDAAIAQGIATYVDDLGRWASSTLDRTDALIAELDEQADDHERRLADTVERDARVFAHADDAEDRVGRAARARARDIIRRYAAEFLAPGPSTPADARRITGA